MSAFTSVDNFFVDGRVCDSEGYKATIRYIGPVAIAKDPKETWIGVEWDDKTRGKHDGSCYDDKTGQSFRYFKCDFGAGSFIKPSKLSFGKSLVEALKERYVKMNAPTIIDETSHAIPDAYITTNKGKTKPVEFIGERKIRKYQQLETINKVSLRNEMISRCNATSNSTGQEGEGNELKDIASHFIELDLQDNLFSLWKEIACIGENLSLLQSLLLHGNKMEQLTSSIAESLAT
jgi:dynactin complex subunit